MMVWSRLLCLISCLALVAAVPDFPALDHLKPRASAVTQAAAVDDLIHRVLGDKASHFKVFIEDSIGPQYKDTFNLVSDGQTVTVTATSGVAASMGFYYYLKRKCGCQYTWAGAQVSLPATLPVINHPGLTITAHDRFRYYQNVCTVSYSFVWWDWARWEREIDWMAMNGINLPLAFTGQEAIFQKVYMKLGMTVEELQQHFGGPAFLAWARMGNMRGWGGPIPQSWLSGQLALQKQILSRMRALGMTPVLPGFAGHVPLAITRLFPDANVSRMSDWGHFNNTYCCTYLLDFQDPLFQRIGTAFIKEMQDEFGVDHVYNADSFNEMDPKSSEPAYLQAAGRAVYDSMLAADPDAIWLMQGWLFESSLLFWLPAQVEALLTSVPQGKMIILDLFAEVYPIYSRSQSFYGQPFIWCMLHNFGGTMELYGAISSINTGPFEGRKFPNSTMIGTGLTPEGINQNEAMYEFMNENAYVPGPRNLTVWAKEYANSRYGVYNLNAVQAWLYLLRSVYNCTDDLRDHSRQVVVTSRPQEHPALHPDVWYDPADLYTAWSHLVNASFVVPGGELFRYDLVDVTRNSLQLVSEHFYTGLIQAYRDNSTQQIQIFGEKLITLLLDIDRILGSDRHFLLGRWIEAARAHGVDRQGRELMEYNARNQVTLWGPKGNIRDYAAKQWSGLISSYYAPRWKLFIQMLKDSVSQGEAFNQTDYDDEAFTTVEQPFTFSQTSFPTTPVGDSISIAVEMFNKYGPALHSATLTTVSAKGKKPFLKVEYGNITGIKGHILWIRRHGDKHLQDLMVG